MKLPYAHCTCTVYTHIPFTFNTNSDSKWECDEHTRTNAILDCLELVRNFIIYCGSLNSILLPDFPSYHFMRITLCNGVHCQFLNTFLLFALLCCESWYCRAFKPCAMAYILRFVVCIYHSRIFWFFSRLFVQFIVQLKQKRKTNIFPCGFKMCTMIWSVTRMES